MSTPRARRNGKENLVDVQNKNTPRRGSHADKARIATPINQSQSNQSVSVEPKVIRKQEPIRQYEKTTSLPQIKDLLLSYKPPALGNGQKKYTEGECQHIVVTLWKRIYQLEVELINNQEDLLQYQQEYQEIKDKGSQLYDTYISQQNSLTDLKATNQKLQKEAEESTKMALEMEEQAQLHQDEWKQRFDEQEELLDQYEQRVAKLEEENEFLTARASSTSKRKSSGFMDAVAVLGDGSFSEEEEDEEEDDITQITADITEEFSIVTDAFNFDDPGTRKKSTQTPKVPSNELQSRNEKLEEQINHLQSEIENLQAALKYSEQNSSAEVIKQLESKEQRIQELESEMESVRKTNDETLTELKETNLRLSRQYTSLSDDYNKVLISLRSSKQKPNTNENNKLASLEKQNTSLQKIQQEQSRNLESLQVELKDEKQKNRELFSKLQTSLELVQYMKDERHVWNSAAISYEDQLDDLQERVVSSEVQLSRALAREKKIADKLATTSASLEETSSSCLAFQEKISQLTLSLEKQKESYAESLQEACKREEMLHEKIQGLLETLDHEKQNTEKTKKKNQILAVELESSVSRELASKDETNRLQALVSSESKAKTVLEEKLGFANRERDALANKILTMKQKLSHSVQCEKNLTVELNEIKRVSEEEEKRLQSLCDQLQEENETLEEKLCALVEQKNQLEHLQQTTQMDLAQSNENVSKLTSTIEAEKASRIAEREEVCKKHKEELDSIHSEHKRAIESMLKEYTMNIENTKAQMERQFAEASSQQQKEQEEAQRNLFESLTGEHKEKLCLLEKASTEAMQRLKVECNEKVTALSATVKELERVQKLKEEEMKQLQQCLHERTEEVRCETERIQTLTKDLEEMQEQRNELTANLTTLQSDFEQMTKTSQQQSEEYQRRIQEQRNELTASLTTLQSELEQTTKTSRQQSEEYQHRIEELNTLLEQSSKESDEMITEIVSKYEETVKELMMEAVSNELDREQLRGQLELLLTYCEEREFLPDSFSLVQSKTH